jgi:hypothetical protein
MNMSDFGNPINSDGDDNFQKADDEADDLFNEKP